VNPHPVSNFYKVYTYITRNFKTLLTFQLFQSLPPIPKLRTVENNGCQTPVSMIVAVYTHGNLSCLNNHSLIILSLFLLQAIRSLSLKKTRDRSVLSTPPTSTSMEDNEEKPYTIRESSSDESSSDESSSSATSSPTSSDDDSDDSRIAKVSTI